MCVTATIVLLLVVGSTTADILEDCSKLFSPQRYLNQLPSLALPYISSLPIPSNVLPIKPSPVVTTRVVSFVTKYVSRSPVCIRYSGEKPLCKAIGNANARPYDNLLSLYGPHYGNIVTYNKRSSERQEDSYIESAESETTFEESTKSTPSLDQRSASNVLIDERLEHLEQILPYYTRRRELETSTITVTKVVNGGEPMATLVVKNCIPQGMEICPKKSKKRKSKVGRYDERNSLAEQFFG